MKHWQVDVAVAFVALLVLSLALGCGPSDEQRTSRRAKQQCLIEQSFSACTAYCGEEPRMSSYNRFDGVRCDCDNTEAAFFPLGARIRNYTWVDCDAKVEREDRVTIQ